MSVFDEKPGVNAFSSESFADIRGDEKISQSIRDRLWKWNFFCYSLMKTSPLVCQNLVYQKGSYGSPIIGCQILYNLSKAEGIDNKYIKESAILDALPLMSEIQDTGRNTCFIIANQATHQPTLLKEPEYIPSEIIDNSEYDACREDRFVVGGKKMDIFNSFQMSSYHVTVASFIKLGAWMEHLRRENVFDNTRIIIVADHGIHLSLFKDLFFDKGRVTEDILSFNPLLMVKDFGNDAPFREDDDFMTNADTPTLAIDGLIENPQNPFTGRCITDEKKFEQELHVFEVNRFNPEDHPGNTYRYEERFVLKRQNVLDANNWDVFTTCR